MSWDNVNDFDFNCYVFVELLILVFTIHCIAWAIICRCSLRILMWGAFNTWCPFWNDFRNCLNYSTLPALLYARLKNGPHEKNPSRNGSDSSTAIRIEDDPLHGWMGWYPPVTASLRHMRQFYPSQHPNFFRASIWSSSNITKNAICPYLCFKVAPLSNAIVIWNISFLMFLKTKTEAIFVIIEIIGSKIFEFVTDQITQNKMRDKPTEQWPPVTEHRKHAQNKI